MRIFPERTELVDSRLQPAPPFLTTDEHRLFTAKFAKNTKMKEPDRKLDKIAHLVIGAAIEVHRFLGPGFLENVYEEALCIELRERHVKYLRQPVFMISYKGHELCKTRLDLLVENQLLVELKAVDSFSPLHLAQVMSYLKATRRSLGLLINFNVPILRTGIKRVILS